MVNLEVVQESNTALRSSRPGHVALFVGATSGIAFHTLTEYARHSNQPKVYIVGRSDTRLSKIIADLEKINPEGSYVPIRSEISLLKNVDAACDNFKSKERHLDLLLMCPGYLKLSRQDNADGLEETISLRYYVRMRFIHNLLPQLSSPLSSRIVSIHGAGKEGPLNEADLELQHNFSLRTAAIHTSTMNTLFLTELAARYPSISCLHAFPGLVITGAFDRLVEDWVFPLPFLFVRVVLPLVKLFTLSLQESGQRHLFHATSARYPPWKCRDRPVDVKGTTTGVNSAKGVPLPTGVQVARGEDGREGSGCYLLAWDGETVGDEKLLGNYRQREMGKRIWEHTLEVFERVLGGKDVGCT